MFTKEADNTRKNNRCANFEALRIVIMLFIIIGHIMMYSRIQIRQSWNS